MEPPAQHNDTDVGVADPTAEFERLIRRLSSLFDEKSSPIPLPLGAEVFTPLADLVEAEDAFILEVELPGVRRKDVEVVLAGQQLRISGERPRQQTPGSLRRQTRPWGLFRYEVTLSGQVGERAHAEVRLQYGVLEVRVPKTQDASVTLDATGSQRSA